MTFTEKVKFAFNKIFEFIYPFIKMFLTEMGKTLLTSAGSAAVTVESTMGDAKGSEKRAKAFELIVNDLKDKAIVVGVDVSESMVNCAIEMGVQKLKEKGE